MFDHGDEIGERLAVDALVRTTQSFLVEIVGAEPGAQIEQRVGIPAFGFGEEDAQGFDFVGFVPH